MLDRIKKFKENTDAMLERFPENKEFIFGYASVFGAIIALVQTIYATINSSIESNVTGTIIAMAILNILLVVSNISVIRRYFRLLESYNPLTREKDNLVAGQKAISLVFHNINHQARNLIHQLNINMSKELFSDSNVHKVEMGFEKYLLFLLDNIKEIFDVLTGDQCSVCLKFPEPDKLNPNIIYIRTQYRDSISFRGRKEVDGNLENYPYYDNTAFKNILEPHNKSTRFYSDDLKNEKGYNNANPNWQDHYNACLVVPISIPSKNVPGKITIIGFICIDNFKGGFKSKIAQDIAQSIADLNFLAYQAFNSYIEKSKASNN